MYWNEFYCSQRKCYAQLAIVQSVPPNISSSQRPVLSKCGSNVRMTGRWESADLAVTGSATCAACCAVCNATAVAGASSDYLSYTGRGSGLADQTTRRQVPPNARETFVLTLDVILARANDL